MPGMKSVDLSQATVIYGGVTFGGSTSTYKALPPRFKLSYVTVHDEAKRVLTGLRYTLSVQQIYYEADQATLAVNQAAMQSTLTKPGKKLEIRGLGLGLDTIVDIDNGPRPIGMPEMRMIAETAWELLWTVEFTINPCLSANPQTGTLLALNYSTAWSNDFEGRCTRSISGYYEILRMRNGAAPNNAIPNAEAVRNSVTITVPDGFRRVQNAWQATDDGKRMNFAITDEQMTGDALPVDIIQADGDETYQTNPRTWSKASYTFNATYRVAPGKNRIIAGQTFLAAALAKQSAMVALLPAGSSVLPASLSIRNGKYQSSNVTSASISWQVTQCTQNLLSAGGLWAPVFPDNTYTQWKASIESLWANRGNAGVIGQGDVILDLCTNTTTATIGSDYASPPDATPDGSLSMVCPDVPENGGWMGYDLRVRVQRADPQTLHRKAVTYTPVESPGDEVNPPAAGHVNLGGPEFSMGATNEHVIERNGLPAMIVTLRFKAYRYKRLPSIPEITSVAGKPVTLIAQDQEGPFLKADLMGCPVYAIRGYRVYRVNAYIATVRSTASKTSCAANEVGSTY